MAGLNPMYTALHESLSDPKAIDVVFWVYSRRKTSKWDKTIVHTPLPIYAMSSVLKKTEYFERLLTSGFAESSSRSYHDGSTNVPEDVEHTISDYDYELDSDLGEEDEPEAWRPCRPKGAKKAGEPSTQPNRPKYNQQYQKVVIKDHAYITWRALIFYLYTTRVNFTTSELYDAKEDRNKLARDCLLRINQPEIPQCSPKSMYRLAHKLGIPKLQALALKGLRKFLSPEIIMEELTSHFTSLYPEIRQAELAYLRENSDDPDVLSSLPSVVTRIVRDDYSHAVELIASLLREGIRPRD